MVRELGINVGDTSEDGRFTLEAVRCLGACGLAPVIMVNEDTHGNVNPKDTVRILEAYQ
jgi:NADH:ubiquinone oxidoreductase subunit E